MSPNEYPALPVLIVDDEVDAAEQCALNLRAAGITRCTCCNDSREVLPMLAQREFSVVLLDLWMPHISGSELLENIVQSYPHIPVIVVTGATELETAVACMRQRAHDYMVKPVEPNRLVAGVRRAVEFTEVEAEYRSFKAHVLSGSLKQPDALSSIVTHNASMLALFKYVETIAKTRKPVLITGETGTGKELFALAVHDLSERQGAFVAVNATVLDDHTLADTLFGHQKGSFTDAASTRDGLIKTASNGTLFLDEIGDLSPANQTKILRLVQEGEYFPLGIDLPRRSTARLVFATNQDLDPKVKDQRFRADLYYRLRVHHIHVPPLRERLDDIPFLVDHFLEKAAAELDKKKPSVPQALYSLLGAYDFPGNVRELESLVFEAVSTHHSGMLSLEAFRRHIKFAPATAVQAADSEESEESEWPDFANCRALPSMGAVRRALVNEALRRAHNNQSVAAALIGVSQSGISRIVKRPAED